MSECQHPFEMLELDIGNSGRRGQAAVWNLRCKSCGKRFPDALGIKLLVESAVADNEAIWKAIRGLGGKRPDWHVLPGPRSYEKADCPHYLSWLRIGGAGTNVRGSAGNISFRCVGCRASWPMAGGLKVFLDQLRTESRPIKAALRKLGVEV